ncbi:hypothetical protein F2P81_016329 [Scophthalmus maximus]|uniref:BHLH domain-containing protein n=1 Tax=Scophthalmus maximus TaxID=52904 RepID=A0A6A4RP77_SCOMX|nr:hypothetical protein F2P81_025819 [Scophthalmus maximus]KAF0031774.1 hypothetical protein F2P81_016329 [Scophthalmus maximus]
MKLFQDFEDAKAQRKSLKPQVERRRRERMNRSLESLKTLLLQRQEETQRRVEKSEILEHTVLFLQNTAKGDMTGAGVERLVPRSIAGRIRSPCPSRACMCEPPEENRGPFTHHHLSAAQEVVHICSSDADEQARTQSVRAHLKCGQL